jgi:hypothetical protein
MKSTFIAFAPIAALSVACAQETVEFYGGDADGTGDVPSDRNTGVDAGPAEP